MKFYSTFFTLLVLLPAAIVLKKTIPVKPDLVIKASQFRYDGANKRIYFKAELSNIGDAPCNINGSFAIQTYLSADENIDSDVASGGRATGESFILAAGASKLLNDEFVLYYGNAENLQNHPYCVIEIRHTQLQLENNYDNNKSIYKHGFPRKKGVGVNKQTGDIPVKHAERFVDLQLTVSNVYSEIRTDAGGKLYKEYTYDAILINIGTADAVIDLDNPITLQYRSIISCQDTTGDNAIIRPLNQNVAYIIKPGRSFVLNGRKANKPADATTAILIELLFGVTERNWTNNVACIPN